MESARGKLAKATRSGEFPKANSGIMRIDPYIGGDASIEGMRRVVKLSANENPFGASPLAITAYHSAAEHLAEYPDGSAEKLRRAIAKNYNIDFERIVCGAGSDELISLLCLAYAGAGKRVVYSQHGFLMYRLAALSVGAEPVAVAELDLMPDISGVISACDEHTSLLFLANPNNPTGATLDGVQLRRIASAIPPSVLLVVDAAYAEYIEDSSYEDGIKLVEEFPNVVMLRTFSKIYGLAALRVGWAYANSEIIDVLNRVRGPFNLSTPAIEAAAAAIGDKEHLQKSVKNNSFERKKFMLLFNELGYKVQPNTQGNFILAHFGSPAAEQADRFLRQKGILLRRMDAYGLPEYLRVSIGRPEQNDLLLEMLTDFAGVGKSL